MNQTGPARPVRILVVDDHPLIRQGLARLVREEAAFDLCGEAASAAQARTALDTLRPDVVVIDISLGGEDGLELVREIAGSGGDVHTLVLSMHSESIYAERAIRAGARGYVMKDEPPARLLEALRRVSEGGIHVSPELRSRWLAGVVGGEAPAAASVESLTDRELLVFRLIGSGEGTRQIAERLGISVKTVESHREKIKRKLGVRSGPELAQRASVWVYRESGG